MKQKQKTVSSQVVDIQSELPTLQSPHTQRAYTRHITNFLSYCFTMPINLAGAPLDALTEVLAAQKVKRWLGELKDRGLGRQSLQQAHAALVWLGGYLDKLYEGQEEYDLIQPRLQHVEVPKAVGKRRLGTWLTRAQVKQVMAAVKKVHRKNPALAERDQIILMLLFVCALRRAEIVALSWNDIVPQGEHLVLVIRHGKGDKPRDIKIPREVIPVLEHWKTTQAATAQTSFILTQVRKDGVVLTDPITPETIRERLQTLAEIAQVPHIAPHDARRTFARSAFEAGATMEMIRQTLGHASVTTTEKYVNATLQLDRAATDIFAESLRLKKRSAAIDTPEPEADPSVPALLTRAQAAAFLGVTMPQFDVLKKSARIKPVPNLPNEASGKPITNAKTRPFRLYHRKEVATLRAEARRRFGAN